MNYWLMKSEPTTYGIDDLKRDKRTHWDGVRNYQARNMLRDDIKKGDLVFFYHSNCDEPGITGIAKVVKEGYPDFTAFEEGWYMVDLAFQRKLKRTIGLTEMKASRKLDGMQLLKRGNRLSVMSVTKRQWETILGME